MRALRLLLLILNWISLLIVPYIILECLCYAGLCGGAESSEIARRYLHFYLMFVWIYPIITLVCLFLSRRFKKSYPQFSLFLLIIPVLCFLPYLYVEYSAEQIHVKYEKEFQTYISPKPEDFTCSQWKFIRDLKDGKYVLFSKDPEGGVVSEVYQTYDQLLKNTSVDVLQCKNRQGESIKTH